MKYKLSWQKWQYIYINANYLHKINGGSTAENVICHCEKYSFPTREEDNSVFGWNKSTGSTWKHYFFGLFPQISTLFTFPNPLPPDREAEGKTAFSESSPKSSGASLWMHHKVWRVIAFIWNLLGLFHPKIQERLSLAHEPLGWSDRYFQKPWGISCNKQSSKHVSSSSVWEIQSKIKLKVMDHLKFKKKVT